METDEIDRLWSIVQVVNVAVPRPVAAEPDLHASMRARSGGFAPSKQKVLFVGLFPPPVNGQRLMTQSVFEQFRSLVEVERYDVDRFPWLGHQLSKLVSAVGACFAVVRGWARGYSALYLAPHSGSLLLLSCLIALAGRYCGYNLAVHYHSYWNIGRRSRLMAAFASICGPRAMHIVLAPPMERDLRHHYKAVKRVTAISNCGFIEPYPPVVRRFGCRRLRIGHLSNLSLEKGIAMVLECVRELQTRGVEVELWLGGPAESRGVEVLIETAQAEFGERLKYLGGLGSDEVRNFYHNIDVFLFPTTHKHEAEPLVVIDAIASGVPVIATDRGCIEYLLGSSAGRVFQVKEFVAGASEQIAGWAAHPDQLAETSELARRRFIEVRRESQLHFKQLVNTIMGERSRHVVGNLVSG